MASRPSRSCAWLLALLALARPVAAQESQFGLQGLGASEETGDVRARALGILGVALDDPRTAISLNPASLGSLSRMTLSVMGVAGRRGSRDATLEDHHGMARFPHQRVALPIFGHVVVSVGFRGMQNFKGDIRLPDRIIDGLEYGQSFERRGNLYAVPLGVSRAFGSRLRAGATLDIVQGTVDESWTTTGDSLIALRTRRRDGLSGRTVTLGVVAYPLRALRLGASFSPQFHLDRDARTTLEDARLSGSARALRDSSAKSEVKWPAEARAGAALQLGPHLLLSTDALRRDWKAYDGRLYGAEALGLESRVGGGIEYRPLGGAWWGRLAYRAGCSRTAWPQRVGGSPLRETTLHLGTGFDFTGGFGRLDLGFEYSRIGNLDENGREERAWRFLLGVSGQETWKRRSPR